MSIQAKKSLGQNFLIDQNIIRKIISAIDIQDNETLVEIGPGQGALTLHLLEAGATVHALEKDKRMDIPLTELANRFNQRLHVHFADALTVDYSTLPTPCKLVGNLPYNVGTILVLNALKKAQHFHKMTFMLQREVVDRMTAKPKTGDWGRLGVWCHLYADCVRLFDVPPSAFVPRPKVMSSIIQITPLSKPRYSVHTESLEKILLATFTKRRKMLRASLKGILSPEEIESAGISPQARPEELSTENFCTLANML